MKRSVCCQPRRAPKAGVGFMGQKKRGYSSSSVAGRELGFTLDQIRALLTLGGPGKASCAEVREIAEHHIEDISAKIDELLSLNSCCVRRSLTVPAVRHQIAPCWIFWMFKVSGHPAHSAVRAQARLCKMPLIHKGFLRAEMTCKSEPRFPCQTRGVL